MRSLRVAPTDDGLMCLIFVLLGTPVVFFGLYSLLFVANLGHTVLALRKWFRDMKLMDPRHTRPTEGTNS